MVNIRAKMVIKEGNMVGKHGNRRANTVEKGNNTVGEYCHMINIRANTVRKYCNMVRKYCNMVGIRTNMIRKVSNMV